MRLLYYHPIITIVLLYHYYFISILLPYYSPIKYKKLGSLKSSHARPWLLAERSKNRFLYEFREGGVVVEDIAAKLRYLLSICLRVFASRAFMCFEV